MGDANNLNNNLETVNENFEQNMKIQKLKEELIKSYSEYKKTMAYMLGDAPLSILCLDTATERCLINHGCLRIYDLFDLDFVKVKGLGEVRIRNLTTSLDKFFSML